MTERRTLTLEPADGFEPEIGRWMGALRDVRRRTLGIARGVPAHALDWRGEGGDENSIGTLLYHIALVEVSWLFLDVRCLPELPAAVEAEFPWPMATADGELTRVTGVALDAHLARLERSRALVVDELRGISSADWRAFREPDGVDYRATPEWTVFHLIEHEAAHAGQITSLLRRA